MCTHACSDFWRLMVLFAKPDFVLEKGKECIPSSGGKSNRIFVCRISLLLKFASVPREMSWLNELLIGWNKVHWNFGHYDDLSLSFIIICFHVRFWQICQSCSGCQTLDLFYSLLLSAVISVRNSAATPFLSIYLSMLMLLLCLIPTHVAYLSEAEYANKQEETLLSAMTHLPLRSIAKGVLAVVIW